MNFQVLATFFSIAALTILSPVTSADLDGQEQTGSSSPPTQMVEASLDELEEGARNRRLTGDLDAILERGYIRVLVPPSKTLFFYDGAQPRGLAYDHMEAFAEGLRKSQGRTPIRFSVIYLPTPRDRLIPDLEEGLGDVAIGGLTATGERDRRVDFLTNENTPVSEVVVTGPGAPELSTLEDLAGRKVLVRKSSSYYQSLQRLNERLGARGKSPVKIEEADEHLETEDILELVASGAVRITVVDDYLATLWADVLDGLTVHQELVLREGGLVGPAIRRNSPGLAAAIRAFQKTHGLGTSFGNVVAKRYLEENPWVRNPNATDDRARFEQVMPIFSRYGEQYGFDAMLLVAQGYQESKLDQSTRGATGAVGIMQIKPSTAAADPINITGVEKNPEANIHAGVKYLRHMADDYFNDPAITPFDRHIFAIAAYNAGPTRIQSLRRKAEAQGLDPDVWFNNVELVSAKAMGRHNVEYVRNILKYWIAFRFYSDVKSPTE